MHVVTRLAKFYDWVPVPKDVLVTEQDIAAGKVMPDRNGGYRMKVVKVPPGGTSNTTTISEYLLIEKIIEEKSDVRKAGRTLTRHQAVAHLLMDNVLPLAAEIDWITDFDVYDDGPNEALMRAKLAQHTAAQHGRRLGRANVPAEHVEGHVAAYLGQFEPLPTPVFKDAEKPTATELEAHAARVAPMRQKNHEALVAFLKQHFGVK